MFDYPVVFVDIETTGGSYRSSRVLEIAAIRYENGQVTRTYSSLINPESYIPANITNLTGIQSSDVVGMPTFPDIADEIFEIMNDAVFVAHNVRFDFSFIKQEFSIIGREFNPKLLCTVRLSRALYPDQRGHSLAKIIDRHNIVVSERHRALADAEATMQFAEIAYNQQGPDAFSEAVGRQLKTQSLPPHLDANQVNSIPDVPGVYVFRDENKLPIYVGKSVTLRKRVMSHFSSNEMKELKISQQVHSIETVQTGSELSALILESKLIKELQPLYNRLLRRTSHYVMLVASEQSGYTNLSFVRGNIEPDTELASVYGMFRNKIQAKKKLDELARIFSLCPKLLGLEKTQGSCFWYALGKCKGACAGVESPELYNRRLEYALERIRLAAWPYPSAVAVPISETGEHVVIDNWMILGFLGEDGHMTLTDIEPNFDIDEYKIIRRFIKLNKSFVVPYDSER